jgi:hypothetical protein
LSTALGTLKSADTITGSAQPRQPAIAAHRMPHGLTLMPGEDYDRMAMGLRANIRTQARRA